jgi:hypothetical protein
MNLDIQCNSLIKGILSREIKMDKNGKLSNSFKNTFDCCIEGFSIALSHGVSASDIFKSRDLDHILAMDQGARFA